jgi:ABC-type multidrug transport system fused ATPase/permease subunit
MAERPWQAFLYRSRNIIRHEVRPLVLDRGRRRYIAFLIRRNAGLLRAAILLSACATLFEAGIPLAMGLGISRYAARLDVHALSIAIPAFAAGLGVYLAVMFHAIRCEKGFSIAVINDIRRQWLATTMQRSVFGLSHSDKGALLSKLSYHLSLLQMGLASCLFPFVQWCLSTIGLIVIAIVVGPRLVLVVFALIPVNIGILCLGYVVSRRYVSQDQTLYSKILRYLSDTFNEFSHIKLAGKEAATVRDFDAMVDVDSYFRVRRELWMRYGNTIIFAVLAFAGAVLCLVEIYYPFLQVDHSIDYVVVGVVLGLLVKLAYLSLRVGLFAFPLKLGLVICTSEHFPVRRSRRPPLEGFESIAYSSRKAKLSRTGSYRRDLAFAFQRGERVLITGAAGSGKTSLGRLFAGIAGGSRGGPWMVRTGSERLSYRQWAERQRDFHIIDPHFQTESTIFELFTRDRARHSSLAGDVEAMCERLHGIDELAFVFDHGKGVGRRLDRRTFSFAEMGILQMACCLLSPPALLVIDNMWLDLGHQRLDQMIRRLGRELVTTTIVCGATTTSQLMDHDQVHCL